MALVASRAARPAITSRPVSAAKTASSMASDSRSSPTATTSASWRSAARSAAAVVSLAGPGPGLVLVAGPAGSGKTTTMAALVDHVGTERACHIVTVEDPVEIMLKDRRSVVEQREVGLDAPTTAAAVRAALRQDVDVAVVGELRDADTVDLAVLAAETGRLVVAGLPARDAVGALGRLLELGAAQDRPALRPRLAGVLRGVVAQQLVPRADGKGRVAAAELLLVDDETRRLVREPGGEAALRAGLATGRPPGSQGFDASLVALARARRISHDAALSRASDAAAVRELLGRAEDGQPKATVEDDARGD